jgi:hypothetical protein
MKREVQRYLELLERRLVTLRLLAADLDASRTAFVDLDLRAMHQHISQQERLCTEIRLLDAELKIVREKLTDQRAPGELPVAGTQLEAQLDPASGRQLQLLFSGLKAVQADVRRLSRVHSEMLRRSRRSVNVLLNFLGHYSSTYPLHVVRPKGMPLPPGGETDHVQPFR